MNQPKAKSNFPEARLQPPRVHTRCPVPFTSTTAFEDIRIATLKLQALISPLNQSQLKHHV